MNESTNESAAAEQGHLLDTNEELEDGKQEEDQYNLPSKVQEISPNERYVRFAEVLSYTENIKVSYRAFDTRNGIEVAWHAIDLSGLNDAEQEEVARSANSLKELESEYIAQYLSVWVDDEPRRLIIITALLESLKEFIGKVRILRWRIVKKWCRQMLRGLSYLHNHSPRIVHRNISCDYIYINGGEGQLKIGNTWLSAILGDDSDPVSFSETMTRHSRIIGSPAYNGPEIFEKRALDTKADIYSLGVCMIEIITRSEPYAECKGIYSKIAKLKMLGTPPLALLRITHPLALHFIDMCLRSDPNERPTADELRRHPFLEKTADYDDDEVILGPLPELASGGDSVEELADLHAKAASLRALSQTDATTERPSDMEGMSSRSFDLPPALGVAAAEQSHPSEPSVADSTAAESATATTQSAPVWPPSVVTREPFGEQAASASRVTPRSNASKANKFGKEFAALYKGEDVREDKGVQDGRRPQGADVEEDGDEAQTQSQTQRAVTQHSSPAADNSAENPPSDEPAPRRVVSPTSIPSGYDISSPVRVNLKISKEHTADGEGREVEFMFNPTNDDFQVVAKEMIEELSLTLPVNNLAESIAVEVVETQRSVIAAYAAMEEERRSHGHGLAEPPSLPATDSVNPPPPATTATAAVEETTRAPGNGNPEENGLASPLVDSVEGISISVTVGTVAAETFSPSADSTTESNGVATPSAAPAETDTPLEVAGVGNTDATPRTEGSPQRGDDAPAEESDDDDLGDLDEEDMHLRQEILRIDKEAGHARRVFEQRIQKHKSIQASLDEDIENRQVEYAEKLEAINKKLEYSRKKAEDERIKLKEEFDANVVGLRETIKQRILEERKNEKIPKLAPSRSSSGGSTSGNRPI